MQQLELTSGAGQATQRRQQIALVLALIALAISGLQAQAIFAPTEGSTPAIGGTMSQASAAREAAEDGGVRAAARSPQAQAHYRAFYEEQMASEAALDGWALPAASALKASPEHSAFYEGQMASEAALEPWTGREDVHVVDQAEPLLLPLRIGDGLPFE